MKEKQARDIASKLEDIFEDLVGEDFEFEVYYYFLTDAFRALKKTSKLGFIISEIEEDKEEEVREEISSQINW